MRWRRFLPVAVAEDSHSAGQHYRCQGAQILNLSRVNGLSGVLHLAKLVKDVLCKRNGLR
jgi:hypothetical protein